VKFIRFTLGILFAVFLTALIINTSTFFSFYTDLHTIQDISLNTSARKSDCVYVGGMPIGMTLSSKGVIVIGITDITTQDGNVAPSRQAGLENGDVLTKIDNQEVENMSQLKKILYKYNKGDKASLNIIRNGKSMNVDIVFTVLK
jgi:S1-C subfamily serine protease